MNFSERLFQLRTERNLKQQDIVQKVGIALRSYQYYEHGEREPPLSVLIALADFYEITLDELVGRNLEQTSVADSETKQILEEMRDMEEHPEKYKSYRSFREGLNDVLGNTEY